MRGSKLDELMTLLFMILAAVAVLVVFITNNRQYFLVIAGIAVVIRLVQYLLRFVKK
ncbi:MAG: hypothetical protein LUG98_00900 [Tannerellaceae bacterium]|nr:hypothetical protein [Tannerellaceae bacterium]